MDSSIRRWCAFALLAVLAMLGCGSAPKSPDSPHAQTVEIPNEGARGNGSGSLVVADSGADPGPVPVTAADPSWGNADALVTLVEFADLQCPFCARVAGTLEQLKSHYGPDKLRIVWKNLPLEFHKNARPAAEAAMAVYELGGPSAFWSFTSQVLGAQSQMSPAQYETWAQAAGVRAADVARRVERQGTAAKIDADMGLAKAVGANGTPHFYVNGVELSGAQPLEKFQAVIDAELVKASALVAGGLARSRLYASVSRVNFAAPKPAPPSKDDADDVADASGTHLVPVGASPVRGPSTALVTIVEFSDFQCPFCKRVQPTLKDVEQRYGGRVRIVWKNLPLPFHPRAEPAAELALEARAEKGDAGFWAAHEAIWASQPQLDDADLVKIGAQLSLDPGKVRAALDKKTHARAIEDDTGLADGIGATGTPTFFINGRKFVGAQPVEKFASLIDEELAKAEALVRAGVAPAAVYGEVQKTAKAGQGFERKVAPPPTAANPSRGAAGAKVVIQEFADFQCPFCGRVEQTLKDLLLAYPGKVRVVWRHKPLPFHADAGPASEAAVEAFHQKGNDGFWKLHDLMLERQGTTGLKKDALLGYAKEAGLDVGRMAAALDGRTRASEVEDDAKLADRMNITGTPAFVINGLYISGAQPLAKFKRAVEAALAEAK